LLDAEPALAQAYADDGFQPLGLAAFFGHADVVNLLLERGAPVNAASRNAQRVMPLHSAVAGQHLAVAQALVAAGADVNATQTDDFTPLQGAAQNGQMEMVRLLLQAGADPGMRQRDGQSALDIAREYHHTDVAALLAEGDKVTR
jgi:ankyrin repeat protein